MTNFKYFLSICIFFVLGFCFYLINSNEKETKIKEVEFWTSQLSVFSDYMNSVIDEFEKQNPHIKIKWIDVPYAEAEKRVLASLLSSNMPDLINITADFNITLASKGALKNIEDGLENYNKVILNSLTLDDKVWGVPFYATSAITIYNKDLIKEFGINESPKTYYELFDIAKKSPKLNNKYLFMPTLTENDTLYKILNKYNLASVENVNSDNAIYFFNELKHLYDNERIPKEAITQTHREVLEKYSSGQIAYIQAGANFLNIIKENSLDVYSKSDILPQLYGEKEQYDFSLMTLAIPLKSKNSKEALLFANFLTNEQNQLDFSKLTGVLPVNNDALKNEYFKKDDVGDLQVKARVIGAKQLFSPVLYPKHTKKHKEIISLINSTVEKILLENRDIPEYLQILSNNWKMLLD